MDAFFAVKEVLLTDQGRAGPGSKALINFNSNCILRLCSQKQFHIDPGCILEGSFLISFIMVQEISLLSQFQHKHIVQYYGSFKVFFNSFLLDWVHVMYHSWN
ncbi:hypothetical protein CK203_061813 [Vitis vinifera]|uniref:Uncharacterized protein n=1 Tax=Vitis vinifera TaxID=29760 RepID=A0A438GIY0_VITVI|nr:hypothetical protein CK203_061813 [Vitis vinifera]